MNRTVLTLGIIAIAIMVGLSACNKDGGPWGPGEDDMMSVSQVLPDEYIPSFDASEFTVEGDLDASDMDCYPEFNRNGDDQGNQDRKGFGNMRDKMNKRMGPGFELRKLFWSLKLDREQLAQVYEIMTAHHDCVQRIMLASQDERQAIMERAREARMDIMAQFREDGDREAAKLALRELYDTVKASLDALVDRDALCVCYTAMIRSIHNILTEEQIPKFERWLKTSKNPCL